VTASNLWTPSPAPDHARCADAPCPKCVASQAASVASLDRMFAALDEMLDTPVDAMVVEPEVLDAARRALAATAAREPESPEAWAHRLAVEAVDAPCPECSAAPGGCCPECAAEAADAEWREGLAHEQALSTEARQRKAAFDELDAMVAYAAWEDTL
jgi:hypothetical protein